MNVVLPATARKIIYAVFVLIGLAIGAIGVWYTSAGDPTPGWLIRVGAVDAFVTSAPLFLAILNVNKPDRASGMGPDLPVDNLTTDASEPAASPEPPVGA